MKNLISIARQTCLTKNDVNMKIMSAFTPFIFQICMTLILLLITNKDILKDAGKQAVAGNHWLPLYFFP